MSAVELRDAEIRLGGRPVLREVSLDLGAGEFVAVLGPNGAGKSTLMRALLGLVPLSAGSVEVLGQPPARAREQVGYLPQRHRLDGAGRIRGLDLVRLGLDGDRWGLPLPLKGDGRRRVDEAIELVGASSYARRPFGELSGGEQQRLLIAQALVRRPQLLILDEPLDGLDLPSQASVAALAREIATRQPVTVLLVAHDVNPLLAHVDRVVYLAGGRALAGGVAEVITGPQLTRLYGAPVEVLRARDGRLVVVGTPEAPHVHGHRHE